MVRSKNSLKPDPIKYTHCVGVTDYSKSPSYGRVRSDTVYYPAGSFKQACSIRDKFANLSTEIFASLSGLWWPASIKDGSPFIL